jgi:hypothetical protein
MNEGTDRTVYIRADCHSVSGCGGVCVLNLIISASPARGLVSFLLHSSKWF